jgi:hypothetical protein
MGLARQLGTASPEGSVDEKIGMGLQRIMARWMRRKNPLQNPANVRSAGCGRRRSLARASVEDLRRLVGL